MPLLLFDERGIIFYMNGFENEKIWTLKNDFTQNIQRTYLYHTKLHNFIDSYLLETILEKYTPNNYYNGQKEW